MRRQEGNGVTADMAAAFGNTVMQVLEAMNEKKLMLRADFARLVPIAQERVNRELPRVFGEYRQALREVEAGKAPPVIPSAIVVAEATAIAAQVWSEYQKQSRRELANN